VAARLAGLLSAGDRWLSRLPVLATSRLALRCFLDASVAVTAVTDTSAKSKLRYDRWSVGQSILVSSAHVGLKWRPLCREDGSVFYNVQCAVLSVVRIFICTFVAGRRANQWALEMLW
jgi:hypothetical protein